MVNRGFGSRTRRDITLFLDRTTKRRCFVLALGLSLVFAPGVCRGETADEVEERIETLRPELETYRVKGQQIEAQINRAESELIRLVDELTTTEAEVKRLTLEQVKTEESLEQADALLQDIELTLQEAEEDLKARRHILTGRLKRMYKRNRLEPTGLLLKAESMSSFTLRYKLLRRLIKEDVRLFKEIQEALTEVKAKRKQKKKHREEIVYLNEKKASELKRLKDQKAHVETLKNKIEYRRGVLIQRAEENKHAAEELEKMLTKLQEDKKRLQEEARKQQLDVPAKKLPSVDHLDWPVGNINLVVSPFGQGVDPNYGTPRFNAGIDIHVSPKQLVLAAADGVILYKGKMAGYGKFIIIEHGSDLATVYAKLDDFMVRINQEVAAGEEIGVTSDQAFHFEVRKGTNCVNPLKWLQ